MKRPAFRYATGSLPSVMLCALAAGCGGDDAEQAQVPTPAAQAPTAVELAAACPGLGSAAVATALPVANTTIGSATLVAATSTLP
jgi:hypothetical protein